jgi:hypothetical protein
MPSAAKEVRFEPFYDLCVGRGIQREERFSGTDPSRQATLVFFQDADDLFFREPRSLPGLSPSTGTD